MDLRVIDMNEIKELVYHDEFGEEVIMMSELEPLLMDFDKMVNRVKDLDGEFWRKEDGIWVKEETLNVDGKAEDETLCLYETGVVDPVMGVLDD